MRGSSWHRGLLIVSLLAVGGCSSTYYAAWEKMGYHKRDILVSRVTDAKESQEAAKEQFQSALEQFASVVKVDGGELETKYRKLKSELDGCESRASAVRSRVSSVQGVAEALFKEWEKELAQYQSEELRSASRQQLDKTRGRYSQLLSAMKQAESKMEPVLVVFRDQVLFLKHNLNARAIDSLQGTVVSLQGEVNQLVADMEKSIAEANSFIDAMQQQ